MGRKGAVVASRLEVVELGIDEDGDPITSMVVVPVENYASPARQNAQAEQRKQLALNVLNDLVADGDKPPITFNLPEGLRVVPVERWRSMLLSRGVIDRESRTKSPSGVQAVEGPIKNPQRHGRARRAGLASAARPLSRPFD